MKKPKICGIICEYNPFHSGHKYHIDEARKISGADFVIAVMSGNFVQRGEPAIFDKWARTEMALKCGADMVLELPTAYALSSAEYFASGAVDILQKTGIVTHISFGSESFWDNAGVRKLSKIAELTLLGPSVDRKSLDKGASFAAASRNSVVTMPNDILATEYLRAMRRLDAKMEVVPVKRVGEGHVGYGSAISIRRFLADGKIDEAEKCMPAEAFEILQREIEAGRGPVNAKSFNNIVLADLRRLRVEGLRDKPFVSEGLEYKIYSAACESGSYEELVSRCTSKRYTSSRIRRIVFASMLGVKRKMLSEPVPYIRVLGMRRSCGRLKDMLDCSAKVPVITSKAKFMRSLEHDGGAMLRALPEKLTCKPSSALSGMASGEFCVNEYDAYAKTAAEFLRVDNNAADLYSLAFKNAKSRVGASELTHPLIFV